MIPQLRFVPYDRFEYARDLVEHLSDAGLRAFSSWECVPATVSVTTHSLEAGPRWSQTVWCLPWPGREVLYWQWPRVAYRDGVLLGRWFEPFCPLAATAHAAAHLIAVVGSAHDVSDDPGRLPLQHS
ncbi:hypothetical protein BJF79_33630 [Actinomadura sp. CNU-125]|nr:hypothetical protein BJF79_33630 [Actinomadura sp. CNU-125]